MNFHTFPRVSGIQKNVKMNAINAKAAKKMYVPQVMVSSISGVTKPIMLAKLLMVILVCPSLFDADLQVTHPCG